MVRALASEKRKRTSSGKGRFYYPQFMISNWESSTTKIESVGAGVVASCCGIFIASAREIGVREELKH